MKLAKRQKQAVRRMAGRMRSTVSEASPPWLRRTMSPIAEHAELQLVDHGMFREVYLNRHRLSDEAWRAAQPAPRHVRMLAREGIKTILNLRDERDCGSYRLELAACEKAGIKLVNFGVKSRECPPAEKIHGAKAVFQQLEYPMLMHCKSGADRVGLMSVLYMHFRKGLPIEEALQQLHWRFGHFKQADTGVLDYLFESYLAANSDKPIEFLDWVNTAYDPVELKREFKAKGFANMVVNRLLRRE